MKSFPKFRLASVFASLILFARPLFAAPVAVNDTFSTNEDTALAGSASTIIAGDFESADVLVGAWDFLDKIQNQFGTPVSQSYPVDSSGNNWKSLNFNATTSTIGPWGSSSMPIQYGGLEGLPGAANVFAAAAFNPGVNNPVTTFLLRKQFTLSAADTSVTSWTMPYICDDGMVIYVNGVEVARVNMPAGTVTPDTLASSNGPETLPYTSLAVTVPPGTLVSGNNILAIELHQNVTTSSDAGLSISMLPSVTDGFTGVLKAFGTNGAPSPFSGNGGVVESVATTSTGGFNGGGGVSVDVGYRPLNGPPLTNPTRSSSAGWDKQFTLAEATTIHLTFRHRLMLMGTLPSTEWGETTLQIDSTKYGTTPVVGPNAYPAGWKSVFRLTGNGSATRDSGWLDATFDIPLAAGTHTLRLGVFSNLTGNGGRHVQGFFDDIIATIPSAGGTVLANDTGGAVTAELVSTTNNGTLVLEADGTFTYTPNANFNGVDSFTYRAKDAVNALSNVATVTITVNSIPDLPVATADDYTVAEDGSITVNAATGVLANDVDADGDTLTAELDVTTQHGTLVLNGNGSFTFTPEPNFFGTDTFSYHATDGVSNSTTVVATLNVTAVNDLPIAVADSYGTVKNTPLIISNPAGVSLEDPIIVGTVRSGATITTPGSLWKYWDGSATPTGPSGNWKDIDFDDSAWDEGPSELGYGDVGEGRPEATVIEDDAIPGYAGGNVPRYTTAYFRKTININNLHEVTALKLEVLRDDGAIVYINTEPAYRNNLTASPSFSTLATNNTLTENTFYDAGVLGTTGETTNWLNVAPTPQLLVEGPNIFAAEVHQSTTNSSDLSFDVKCTLTRLTNRGLLYNDIDQDGDTLTAIQVTGPSNGSLTLNPNGTFTYTPNTGFLGQDSFTYKTNDGTVDSNTATVTISVSNASNSAPVAENDAYDATEDTPLTVVVGSGVLANDTDVDVDPLTAVLVSNVANGTLVLNTDGSFDYTPNANYAGTDSFTYRAKDNSNRLSVAAATVTITVAPVNDPPVAANETYGVDPGQTLTVAAPGVVENDTDIDTAAGGFTAVLVAGPASGTLNLATDGSFTYQAPVAGGTQTFTYRVNDGSLNSLNVATVTIFVNAAPVAGSDAYTVNEDQILTLNAPGVLVNDADAENVPLSASVISTTANGTLSLSANGAFTYTPTQNFAGFDSFTYRVTDGQRQSAPATVTITVTNVNDAPVAVADAFAVLIDSTLTVAAPGILANDSDADVGAALNVLLVQTTMNGQLTLLANGGLTYVPNLGFIGTDSFTYRLSDGITNSNIATATIAVRPNVKNVLISEIMYYPSPAFPEPKNREWLEIHNMELFDADISGWALTSGVNFTFPPNTIIPANGYLVVVADTAAFQVQFPSVANFVGPWVGGLSNSGESITLSDATGAEIDSMTYADAGDWALRGRETTFGGWEWRTLASGGGRSMELINPALGNGNGQNWAVSTGANGTPGVLNSVTSTDVAPLISDVVHSPAVPKSTDSVTISCTIEDEKEPNFLTTTLFWRDATSTSPGAFQQVPMVGNGKGDFAAILGPKADKVIVEFYISATDGTNVRTWPAPTTEGQNANCQYQVDNEVTNGTDTYYRLTMTAAENAAYDAAPDSSDRQFNQTLITTRGADTSIRYRSSMRTRGNGSRSYQFRPLRITIPTDDRLDDARAFNLVPRTSFLQFLGMRIFEVAGLRATEAAPIEFRRNGVEYTTNNSTVTESTPDYGKWTRLEEINGDMVDNHWPDASTGNLYKKGRNDFYWRSTQPAPSNPDSLLDGWSKQNNSSENDWSDLRSFLQVWQAGVFAHFPGTSGSNAAEATGGSLTGNGKWDGTACTPTEIASLNTVADLDQWAKWFAIMTILQSNETNLSNGQDDDYSCYFVPSAGGQRRKYLLPHDLDTIFGLGDSPLSYNSRGLYDCTEETYVYRTMLPLLGTSTVPVSTSFRTAYHNAIRTFYGGVLNADTTGNPNPPMHALIDAQLSGWVPPAVLADMKTFATQRQAYLLSLIGAAAITPNSPTSAATLDAPHGELMIHEILAENVTAHNVGGLYPDIIELHNSGASAIDLSGITLTDDVTSLTRYTFPPGSSLAAGAYLVLYADGGTGPNHLPFSLNRGGETVTLFNSVANGGGIIDSISFGLQIADHSVGRTGVSLNTWELCTPTMNAANLAISGLGSPADIRINEWSGSHDYMLVEDFVELYNPTASPVAIGRMAFTDDAINDPTKFLFPHLSYLPASGFVAFDAIGSTDATPGNALELPFKIGSLAGSLSLLGQNLAPVDAVDIISQPPDASTGRSPDGGLTLTKFAIPTSQPTPGATNVTPPANVVSLLTSLRVTEIHYNPNGGGNYEFIELQNIGATSLELAGVRFTKGIDFTFPAYTLAPGAYVVVAKSLSHFQSRWGTGRPVLAPFSGSLDNGGEDLYLRLPAPYELYIHRFEYKDGWESSTDGQGNSLQVVSPLAYAGDWDERFVWQAGIPSPGEATPFDVQAGLDSVAIMPGVAVLNGSLFPGTNLPSEVSLAWSQVSGPGTASFNAPSGVDSNATFTAPGTYVLRLSATASAVTVSDDVTVYVVADYNIWIATQFPANNNPEVIDQSADPDKDGIPNLIEFALNLDPKVSSQHLLPAPSVETGFLSISYQRINAPGLTYAVEVSDELGAWNPTLAEQSLVSVDGVVETWIAIVPVPVENANRQFIRVRVSSDEE